jgi:hypothetical protein
MAEMQSDDVETTRHRLARFGKLPAHVEPDATVEMVDTKRPRERPETAGTEAQRQVFLAGG